MVPFGVWKKIFYRPGHTIDNRDNQVGIQPGHRRVTRRAALAKSLSLEGVMFLSLGQCLRKRNVSVSVSVS